VSSGSPAIAGPRRSLTRLDPAQLARLAPSEVEPYVDGDNGPALAIYRRLGLTDAAIDVVLRPAQRS
jgi:ribosomal protein S18 acetylase RimI-like enzyme